MKLSALFLAVVATSSGAFAAPANHVQSRQIQVDFGAIRQLASDAAAARGTIGSVIDGLVNQANGVIGGLGGAGQDALQQSLAIIQAGTAETLDGLASLAAALDNLAATAQQTDQDIGDRFGGF